MNEWREVCYRFYYALSWLLSEFLTVQLARGVPEKEKGNTWGEMIEDNDCEKRDKSCFTRLFETYCDEHKRLAFCYVRQIFIKSRRRNKKIYVSINKNENKKEIWEKNDRKCTNVLSRTHIPAHFKIMRRYFSNS